MPFVVPMSPQNVDAKRGDNATLIVQWRNLTLVEARGWLVKYTVYYWDKMTQNRMSGLNASTDGVKTSLNISKGVDNFTTYVIVVTAHTVVGEGKESLPKTVYGQERPGRNPNPNPNSVIHSDHCIYSY